MQHFADFSNAARKSFTRQKQAAIQGQGSSYVDKIQTARRGQTTPIESPYYISRNEAMTHPQDNKVLVAAQRKLAPLGQGARNNEHGVRLFRPEGKDSGYKNGRLVVGSTVEGNKQSTPILDSNAKLDGRYMWKKDIGSIHTHPTSPKNSQVAAMPSLGDLRFDYDLRKNKPSGYESLILSTPSGKQAKTTVVSYKQTKELPSKRAGWSDSYQTDIKDIKGLNAEIAGLGGQYNTFTPS